ncbi:MAG: small multi-drug export protein [Thermoprotei archaeon]
MDIHKYVILVLVALAPGIEARGAYPLAYAMGLETPFVFPLIYIASSLPAFPLIYGLRVFEDKIVYKVSLLKKVYEIAIKRVRSKAYRVASHKLIFLALALYVAIPLPGTGVWTGSLISYVLGLDKSKSLLAVLAGNLIACTILYALVLLGALIL